MRIISMPPSQKINLKDKIDDGEIDLSMCDLQDVPVKDIANIKNIFSLDLSNNHLVTLPKNFATLKFLTKLDLSRNSLKELPDNFGDLLKLKHLDLYKNELQHLPLSFSKLKTLKWLDLKDNPLVPVIRETAGPCLDSKQCLACAKNVVQFYTEFQRKVEAEREMREKQRQKDLLANELATQKLKQQEKKNKKKERKLKMADDIARNNNLNDETIREDVTYIYTDTCVKEVPKSSTSSVIFAYINVLIVHVMLFFTLIFVLTSLKTNLTSDLELKIGKYWGQLLDVVPPAYHCYLNDFSHYFLIVHSKIGKGIYIIVYYVKYLLRKINASNINYVYEKILNFYYDLFKIK